jgi:drug/metabolite transporter (DMT)-like permease
VNAPAFRVSTASLAILLVIGTTVCFALLDAVAKLLARDMHPIQVVWGRYAFHLLLLLPWMLRKGPRAAYATARPGLNVARAGLLCAVTLMFFTAIAHLPLVDAQAISFVMPLAIVALAHVVLGEKVGPRRWAAVLVGFAGVMLIVRPSGAMHWAALLCLAMALVNACFHVVTRMLARTDPARTQLLYAGTGGTLVFSVLAPFVWVDPDPLGWLGLAAMGLFGAAGHWCLGEAYARAQPAPLAPYIYVQIVWAALLGWAIFGHWPDAWTFTGAGIVVAAGLYVFHRERATARAAP